MVRAQCLEIALECAVSPNEDVRTRAVRLVSQRLHGVKTLAAGIEAFALHHLDEASAEGKRALAEATRLAEKASESLSRAKEKKAQEAASGGGDEGKTPWEEMVKGIEDKFWEQVGGKEDGSAAAAGEGE